MDIHRAFEQESRLVNNVYFIHYIEETGLVITRAAYQQL